MYPYLLLFSLNIDFSGWGWLLTNSITGLAGLLCLLIAGFVAGSNRQTKIRFWQAPFSAGMLTGCFLLFCSLLAFLLYSSAHSQSARRSLDAFRYPWLAAELVFCLLMPRIRRSLLNILKR